MVTKWKKFSRSKLTKALAFVLAVVFFALTALTAAGLYAKAVQSEESKIIVESYISENGYRAVNGSNFRKALSKYLEAAVKTKLIFKDGSKSDFESFKKLSAEQNKNKILSEKENLLDSLKSESGGVEFSDLLEAVEEGTVTLKKLGGHRCYVESGTTFFQGGNGRNYITDKYGQTYYDYYDYYAELQALNGEPNSTTVNSAVPEAPTQAGGNAETVTVPQTRPFYYEDMPHSQTAVPSSIKEKASDPSNVIEICSLRHTTDNLKYDGYYEFFIDETRLAETVELLNDSVGSYNDFKEKAEHYKKEFESFTHAFIAFFDEKTEKVIFSNIAFPAGSPTLTDLENAAADAALGFAYRGVYGGELTFGGKTNKGSLAADNISAACLTLTNNYMPFLSTYSLIVTTDSFFSDEKLSAAPNSSDPFESALAASNAEQETVNRGIFCGVLFLALFLVLTVFLVAVAGKTPEGEEVKMLRTDKIFTLLRTAINAGLIWILLLCAFYYADWMFMSTETDVTAAGVFSALGTAPWFLTVLFTVCCAGVGALFLDWLLFVSRHLKNRSLLKNSFVLWLSAKIKAIAQKRRETLKNQPAVYKDIFNDVLKKVLLLVLLPNMLIGVPCVFSYGNGSFGAALFGLLLALYDLCALAYAVYYAFGVRKVFAALEEMRKGSADIKIDTTGLPKAVRCAAVDAIHLGEGLKAAVENAVKEEKMKAELITNVSHDLKTPLTSIINYSDLLSRCDITDETAKSYIAVLSEKSVRLKKLIEDLVEASKASSGAIKVEMRRVSLTELARQLVGEYEDEFEARGLELVVEGTERELFVLADGKLCYRVLDNLLCNVKKYAMPNTRVYMTLSASLDNAKITLKNVSANRLNISPEELKARFVRGDEARSGEGNGLGLSIADNLCTLQGGKLELEIIGDLFCAQVTLKIAN